MLHSLEKRLGDVEGVDLVGLGHDWSRRLDVSLGHGIFSCRRNVTFGVGDKRSPGSAPCNFATRVL